MRGKMSGGRAGKFMCVLVVSKDVLFLSKWLERSMTQRVGAGFPVHGTQRGGGGVFKGLYVRECLCEVS